MEASFKSRVEQAFGALHGSSLTGVLASRLVSASSSTSVGDTNGSSQSWSVSEVAISRGVKGADESSGSEDDEPCAARYEKFVQLANRGRERQASEDDEGLDEENEWDEDRAGKRRRSVESEVKVSAENGKQDLDEEEECRQMRLMVGMDDTLDFEEEEDEYDKLAVGREGVGERVYMREIKGADAGMSPLTPLPDMDGRQLERDFRANHAAAAARLLEDDRLAAIESAEVTRFLTLSRTSGKPGSNMDIDVRSGPGASSSLVFNVKSALKSTAAVGDNENAEAGSSKFPNVANEGSSNGIAHENAMQENRNSSIEHDSGVKEAKLKKVKFAVDDHVIQKKESVAAREVENALAVSMTKNRYGRVPDHVRNPSKYTYYALEWSDEEEDSKNITAFPTMRVMTQAPEKQEVTNMEDFPESITFTSRSGGGLSKKGEAKHGTEKGFRQSQALVSFAEEVVIDSSLNPDETSHITSPVKAPVETKSGRVFRKRSRADEEDDTSVEENAS